MSNHVCPLCQQPVSQGLYEKITGIWREKEKSMAALKIKEKQLLQKEKDMMVGFEKKEEKLRKAYEKRLADETGRALKEVKKKMDLEARQRQLASVREAVKKEQGKLRAEREKVQKKERLMLDRNSKLLIQYRTLQNKHQQEIEKANRKITSLEEQVKKNQTPQVLGLLEEDVFLKKLKENYPGDRFEHPGKGGDIIHFVKERGETIGRIVYELKKVAKFSSSHVEQALAAKRDREADYCMLVTNAKPKKDVGGLSVQKEVIIVHPAAAFVLIGILRTNLIAMARAKLGLKKREKNIQAVLDYIQGARFRNNIESVIQDTFDLHHELKSEVERHLKSWKVRQDKYRAIISNSCIIKEGTCALVPASEHKQLPASPKEITSIALPAEIK